MGSIPWVSPKDFTNFYITITQDHISEKAINESSAKLAPSGSVLVVVRSGILAHTLPVAINTIPVSVNQDVKVLITDSSISAEYLAYYLKVFEHAILSSCVKHSTTVQSINTAEFSSLEIPVPSKSKQHDLIFLMNAATERQYRKLQQAENLLLGINEFIMQSLGLTFDENTPPMVYATKALQINNRIDADFYSPRFVDFRSRISTSKFGSAFVRDICLDMTSGFAAGKQAQADDLPDTQRVLQLRPFSISPYGQLSFTTQKFVPIEGLHPKDYCQKNEVLFNNTNSDIWVGKTTVFDINNPCVTSNHITRIILEPEVNPYYIAAFFNALRSIGYWKLLSTFFNNQAGVNNETLRSVKIILPDIDMQNKIAQEVQKRQQEADALKNEAEQEWLVAKAHFEKELLGE